ncbi:MAG: hypothetical protein Q8O54_09030 [Brevundimonas sp.]|nr:hypothetical protein [Brevundimonas sp.]
MADWQWWLFGIVGFVWAMDIHRRVSVTMDAVQRMEARLNRADTDPDQGG